MLNASILISDAQVYGNTAGTNGGGIANYGILTMAVAQLSDNTARQSGGGLYNGVNNATFNNVQCTGNSANKGGGFYLRNGSLAASGCTLSGNTAAVLGPGGCFVQGATWQDNGGNTINDRIEEDPNP